MPRRQIFDGDYRLSTEGIPRHCRINYWQDVVSDKLVGVDCTASESQGLEVMLSYTQLGHVGVAEVIGNRHVVERNQRRIRMHQKDSLFVCVQLAGSSHILQAEECLVVEAGDVFYYATSSPYVHGSTTEMHTLIVDIPIDGNFPASLRNRLGRPGKLGRDSRFGCLALTGLMEVATQLRKDASADSRSFAGAQLLGLSGALFNVPDGSRSAPRSHLYVLLRAKAFIEENLENPMLDTSMVANAIGLSARQLNRIFELDGTSVSRFVWNRRLECAHGSLVDMSMRHVQVAEIAFRWGFSSSAHFTRAFRKRYGLPPGALRTEALARFPAS